MWSLRAKVVVMAAAAAMLAWPAAAVTTQILRESTAEEFNRGKIDGLSIVGGGLALAPRATRVEGLNSQFVWRLAEGDGAVFAGAGSPGVVYRIAPGGKAEEYYRSSEMHVHCVAVDSHKNVYAGTSPRGMIFRIAPDRTASIFHDSAHKYIWAMGMDAKDNLIVGTGLGATVARIAPDGQMTELYDAGDGHILSLAMDEKGGIYAGSEPRGLVYYISPEGKTNVVHDFGGGEVRALALKDRSLFVALSSPKPPPRGAQAGGAQVNTDAQVAEPPGAAPGPQASAKAVSGVYEVELDWGRVTLRLDTGARAPLSLAVVEDKVYAGCGDDGRLLAYDRKDRCVEVVASLAEKQPLALMPASGRRLMAACANPGAVVTLEEEHEREGTYISRVHDGQAVSKWGALGWRQNCPVGTHVRVSARSGNSGQPDNTWSSWTEDASSPGAAAGCPAARFAQYRLRLATVDPKVTPLVEEVTLAYLPVNLAPVVQKIEFLPVGAAKEKDARPGSFPKPDLKTPDAPAQGEAVSPQGISPVCRIQWQASDPNGDELLFQAMYRLYGGKTWRPIGGLSAVASRNWDTLAVPDGRYEVRVVAVDAPSNPVGTILTGELTSEPMLVDNTRPVLLWGKVTTDAEGKLFLEGVADDNLSPIVHLWLSVNGGRWSSIAAADGVLDSRQEPFKVALPKLPVGEHVMVVRIMDAARNIGSGSVTYYQDAPATPAAAEPAKPAYGTQTAEPAAADAPEAPVKAAPGGAQE
ncbi:MAG TPA: hypothetical protein P5137_12605 [Candidatus Brocadiia bacterium]|nr:hypothetical protein [Candidatus Brocadiia bacterium]